MENIGYLICLLINVECYGLGALLKVYLKEEQTNKRHPKQLKQQESDISGYSVLNLNILNCFNLHLTTKTLILITLKHIKKS